MIICCNTRFIILEKKSKSEKKFFCCSSRITQSAVQSYLIICHRMVNYKLTNTVSACFFLLGKQLQNLICLCYWSY